MFTNFETLDAVHRQLPYLKRLARFDIRADQNFRAEHDSYENEIQSFYQDFIQHYGSWIAIFRQDTERKSVDKQTIEVERNLLVEARKQSEELVRELQALKKERDSLKSGKSAIAATKLAIHFNREARSYNTKANWWFIAVVTGYISLLYFLYKFTSESLRYLNQWSVSQFDTQANIGQISMQLNYAPVVITGFAKFIILAALWYGLSFLIRNYNVNSHLSAVNRHRTAVAMTLDDFLISNPERQSEMLKNATDAMFKHAPIGFIVKAEKDSGNPILEIVNKIIGNKSNS